MCGHLGEIPEGVLKPGGERGEELNKNKRVFVPPGQRSGINEILQRAEGGQGHSQQKMDLDGCNINMEGVEGAGDTALQN